MCKLKSAIILKNRIFMPDYDSHSQMLEELGIEDSYLNASKTFVRAELSPVDGNAFSNIDDWVLRIDQDITPDWFDAEDCETRMREAVKKWAKTHIYIGVDNLEISSGENYYIKDCYNVIICGTAKIKIICGSTVVYAIHGSAEVFLIRGSAKVKSISDTAIIQHVADSATIQEVCDLVIIREVTNSATIEKVRGSAVIQNIHESAVIKKVYDSAIIMRCNFLYWKNSDNVKLIVGK